MAQPTVYLETSVISYLAARPSRDLIVAANQIATNRWWETERSKFDLFISQAVLDEVQEGDPEAARRRLRLVEGIPLLDLNDEVVRIAELLALRAAIPRHAIADALHVATAAVHNVRYLLTWNCKHIAHAHARTLLESGCREAGLVPPAIATPLELGERTDV